MDHNNYFEFEDGKFSSHRSEFRSMASAIPQELLHMRNEIIRESFSDFRNVEHRLEKAGNLGGIEFINDSKSTNVNSAWYSLETVTKPIVWIVGSVQKPTNYNILIPLVEKKVKSIIVLGNDARQIHESFSRKVNLIVNTQSLKEAVQLGYHLGDKGDCVLLSPACPSFDMFENYGHRGREFKSIVRNM